MQVLDQEITAARPVREKHFDLVRGGRIDLASLGRRFGPLPSLARMFEGADLVHIMTHRERLVLAFVTGFISQTLALGMPDAKRNACANIMIWGDAAALPCPRESAPDGLGEAQLFSMQPWM